MAKQVFVEGTGYVLRYWLFPVVRKQHIRLLCFGVQFLRARFGHDGFAFNRVLTFVVSRSALRWSWSECEARGSRKDSKKDYLDDHCCCFVYFVLVSFFLSLSVWTVYIRLYCSTLHLSLLCGWQMPTVQLTPSFTCCLMRSFEINLRLSWKNAVRNSDVKITFWYFEIFFFNFHDSWKVSHLLNPFFFVILLFMYLTLFRLGEGHPVVGTQEKQRTHLKLCTASLW